MAEPRPIHHDAGSTLSTTGWETAKGGVLGFLAAIAVGAVIGGGAMVLGGALVGAILPGVTAGAGAAAMFSGGLGAVTAIAAVVGGFMSGSSLGTIGAVGGGLLGMARGGSKITKENMAFSEKVARNTHAQEHATARRVNDAANAGMQQGYQMGFQEGAQHVVQELQKMQYAAIQQEMQNQHAKHGILQLPEDGHAAKIARQREAQAAAGQQIT